MAPIPLSPYPVLAEEDHRPMEQVRASAPEQRPTGGDQLLLQILVASTRPGRVGMPVAKWAEQRAREHGGFAVDLVDLLDVALPFMDEPNHPRLRQYVHPHTLSWSATIDRADAFVFVVPEYNYGYSAVIKNALDFLHQEWQYKPVGLVSYGGIAAGTRGVQQLKQVLGALKLFALNEAVHIPYIAQYIGPDGALEPTEMMEQAMTEMLDEELEMARVLAARRRASS